jgi:Signal transduction histidine kinase
MNSLDRTFDIIDTLCSEYTSLTEVEIGEIFFYAKQLSTISQNEDADVFIDCPCSNAHEAIVVAESLKKDSLYAYSTIGYIVNDRFEPAVFRTLRYGLESNGIIAITHAATTDNKVVQKILPIKYLDRVIGIIGIEKEYPYENDNKKQKNISVSNLKHIPFSEYNNELLYNITWLGDCIDDGLILCDQDYIVVYRNTVAYQMYMDWGYLDDLLGKYYMDITMHGIIDANEENRITRHTFYMKGHTYLAKICMIKGEQASYVVLLKDISKEVELATMIKVNYLHLREVQHRVKNQLNIVCSFLEMQNRRLQSPEEKMVLYEAINRILAIADSSSFYNDDVDDEVDLRQLLSKVINNFMSISKDTKCIVNIDLKGDTVSLNSRDATTVAIIVNELIQNSYWHAFNQSNKGNVVVSIMNDGLSATISVYDDGVGISKKEIENAKGWGITIIKGMIEEQLGSQLRVEDLTSGAEFRFDLPIKNQREEN